MRRLAALVAAVAAAGVLAATAAASNAITLATSGGSFPFRSLVLSVPPGTQLHQGDVTVRENGNVVPGVTILPSTVGGSRFGTVLVLDASNSMAGKPIRAALAAARTFAEHRNLDQPLAVITFNNAVHVIQPFTSDGGAINRALSTTPALAEHTHIFDGVMSALSLIHKANVTPGSIVLLTDGADVGSSTTLDQAVKAAQAAHVRVYAVGLQSRAYDPTALEEIASKTGGSYSVATSPKDLQRIYDALGARLANEYLVTYRSFANLGSTVRVSVQVSGSQAGAAQGQRATAEYVTPSLPKAGGRPYRPTLGYRLWRSALSMLLVAFAVGGLVALATLLFLRPPPRTFRRRMSEFVSLAPPPDRRKPKAAPAVSRDAAARARQPLIKSPWWDKFNEELEIAQIKMSATQIVLWTAVGTVFAMWFFALVFGAGIFAVLGLFVPMITRSIIKRKLNKRREAFAEQLPDNLHVLSSALRAGHSLIGALSIVVDESEEPSRSEFRRVIADEQLGVPLEEALGVVVRRMDNHDLEQVALVASLQRRSGGNAAEVLDRVTETIRERFELRRLVKTLTAQGRLSRWIVSLLPLGLVLVISLIDPGYLHPLFKSGGGQILLVMGIVMVVLGSLVIKKIVEIKV